MSGGDDYDIKYDIQCIKFQTWDAEIYPNYPTGSSELVTLEKMAVVKTNWK